MIKKLIVVSIVVFCVSGIGVSLIKAQGAGTIRGCVKPGAGQLIVLLDEEDNCKSQETPLEWNIEGPQGPAGPPGPPGPPGGTDLTGFYTVSESGLTVPGLQEVALHCDPEDFITGFGWDFDFDQGAEPPNLTVGDADPTTGVVTIWEGDTDVGGNPYIVYAICADFPPAH